MLDVEPPSLSSSKTFSSTQMETLYPFISHSLCPLRPQPLATTNQLQSLWIYLFCVFHIIGIIQVTWLLSLSIMLLSFIHTVTHVSTPFLFVTE